MSPVERRYRLVGGGPASASGEAAIRSREAAVSGQLSCDKQSVILIQAVCPGMLTEHFSLITDAPASSLIVDGLLHDGPASVARSGAREACTASPLNPSGLAAIDRPARKLPGILEHSIANGPPQLPLVSEEPPLKPYAE